MFYQLAKLTRRVMAWLNPPQGVTVEPLPAVELVEFRNAQTGRVEIRQVERDGNTVRITRMEA